MTTLAFRLVSMPVTKSSKKDKPAYGLAMAARRKQLNDMSGMDVENATKGVIYQKLLYRMENGQKDPLTLDLVQFNALLSALNWTPEEFAEETKLTLPKNLRARPEDEERDIAMRALERLEVHPDWVAFPVYGAVSAGSKSPQPLENEVAYFPLEKLVKKGAKTKDIRVYLVNGDCMISPEAARVEKNIAPYDYIAVDTGSRPRPGDVVVAWWPQEDKMVVKRYRVEYEGIVLSPTNPAHPNLVLGHEDDLMILGRVVMRTG